MDPRQLALIQALMNSAQAQGSHGMGPMNGGLGSLGSLAPSSMLTNSPHPSAPQPMQGMPIPNAYPGMGQGQQIPNMQPGMGQGMQIPNYTGQ